MVATQDRLLALTEPSLQIKVSPWQPDIPPFFPLQGVFPASTFCARARIKIVVRNARTYSPKRPECNHMWIRASAALMVLTALTRLA